MNKNYVNMHLDFAHHLKKEIEVLFNNKKILLDLRKNIIKNTWQKTFTKKYYLKKIFTKKNKLR